MTDQVWVLRHMMPGYMPQPDEFWHMPDAAPASPGERLTYLESVWDWAVGIIVDEFDRYDDGTDCAGDDDCAHCGDRALLEGLASAADLQGDMVHALATRGAAGVVLDSPNNGYGDLWELGLVSADYVESN